VKSLSLTGTCSLSKIDMSRYSRGKEVVQILGRSWLGTNRCCGGLRLVDNTTTNVIGQGFWTRGLFSGHNNNASCEDNLIVELRRRVRSKKMSFLSNSKVCLSTSCVLTSKPKQAPVIKQPAKKKNVIDIWKNMTVNDLAQSANRPIGKLDIST